MAPVSYIKVALCKRALPHLDWFEMVAVRGRLTDGEVAHYQVTIKVGYRFGADGR